MNKTRKSILLAVLLILLACTMFACGSEDDSTEGSQTAADNEDMPYDSFVESIHRINDEDFDGFKQISNNGVVNAYTGLPENTIDDRERDDREDGSPSNYKFEFINDAGDVYVRTTFMYYTMDSDGFLLHSVNDPKYGSTRKDGYATLEMDFPDAITSIFSINGYTVLVQYVLSTEVDKGSHDKDIDYLAEESNKFLSSLQAFLEKTTITEQED